MKRTLVSVVILVSLAVSAFAAPLPANGAYVILNNASLYQDEKDALKFLESLTIGDAVTLMGRTYAFKESGATRDFTRVKAVSGKEGWVRTDYIAPKSRLGVVKEADSLLFSEPRDVKVTGKSISPITIVAILTADSTGEFMRVLCWDAPKGVLYSETNKAYMMPRDITTAESDVQAAILYTVAKGTKAAAVKNALLKQALSKYPDSFFAGTIDALLNGTPAATSSSAAASAIKISVRASSTLPAESGSKYRYDADLLFDGNPLTAWAEGGSGSGEGETIEVTFDSPAMIDAITVMPGFFDARWFKTNIRVKEMKVEIFDFTGGSVYLATAPFKDEMTEQRIPVGEVEAARVVFTITAVYAPENKDLAISEISFSRKGAVVPVQASVK